MDDIRKGMNVLLFATSLKGSRELWHTVFPRVNEEKVSPSFLQDTSCLHLSVLSVWYFSGASSMSSSMYGLLTKRKDKMDGYWLIFFLLFIRHTP